MRWCAISTIIAFVGTVLAGEPGALSPPGLQPLINRANALLSSGQFLDAANAYTEAIEQSPADYVLYYKRATAYYSLSRHTVALEDFEKVLSLTSNSFDNALLMTAKIHTKDGRFAEAREALNKYIAKVPSDRTAQAILDDVEEAERAANMMRKMQKAQLWAGCAEAASQALKVASHSSEIRAQRAQCSLASGDIESAVADQTRLSQVSAPSTTSFMRNFRLAYFFLPASSSPMTTLKQCLHFDPDSKPCLTAHRFVKSVDKTMSKLDALLGSENWSAAIKLLTGKDEDGLVFTFDKALEDHTTAKENLIDTSSSLANSAPLPNAKRTSPRRAEILRRTCRAYIRLNDIKHGVRWCEALLSMEGEEEDGDGLVGRGEAQLAQEDYEAAVRTFEKAFEVTGRSRRDIHERVQKAQRLLKQSRQKDYYKVLGVSRDADTKTIKKAFRKAAKEAHPDKGGSEAKMAAVNEAYGVLNDPELRQRYDNGDDPNDPTGGMGGGGGFPFGGAGFGADHPFSHFFQSGGGGGGGGFKFHFSHGGH